MTPARLSKFGNARAMDPVEALAVSGGVAKRRHLIAM